MSSTRASSKDGKYFFFRLSYHALRFHFLRGFSPHKKNIFKFSTINTEHSIWAQSFQDSQPRIIWSQKLKY